MCSDDGEKKESEAITEFAALFIHGNYVQRRLPQLSGRCEKLPSWIIWNRLSITKYAMDSSTTYWSLPVCHVCRLEICNQATTMSLTMPADGGCSKLLATPGIIQNYYQDGKVLCRYRGALESWGSLPKGPCSSSVPAYWLFNNRGTLGKECSPCI